MATNTGCLFSSLPLELRQKIYMLATPPRIVHVQEEPEDQEEFEETIRTTPIQLKLDPALAHFAFNWRLHIHRHSTQQTLESYGITGGKPLHLPWEPSAATPEIPLHWLANQPKVAWELVREGYLYSKAPIPPLLHTCSESRAELMSRGYQLTFRTRSNGPRTWFNFERDVLYIDFNSENQEDDWSLLSGGPWDIGQFHPEDLKRVRKLALNKSGHLLLTLDPNSESAFADTRQLSGILRLFSAITELLLVEWSEFSDNRSLAHSWQTPNTEQDKVDTPRELWRCVAVEEIDALLSLIAAKEYRTKLPTVGDRAKWLKDHKQQNGDTVPYFQYTQLHLEQLLLEQRDAMVSDIRFGSVAPWEIPRIKAVHVLPSSTASFLSRKRQIAWVEFSEMKRRQREVPTPSPTVCRATMVQVTARPESPLPFGPDDEEAFDEAHGGPCCGQCEYGYYLDKFIESEEKWWVEEGSVPAPGDEVIY